MIDLQGEIERMRQGVYACDHGIESAKIDDYIAMIERIFPGRHYCVIADWVWNDIDACEADLKVLAARELKPAFLYSRNILLDSEERGFQSVMTSMMKSFSHNAIFETENRIYLLCGSGKRNLMDQTAYFVLFANR